MDYSNGRSFDQAHNWSTQVFRLFFGNDSFRIARSMAEVILEVKNLTKRFGPPTGESGFLAVNDISFEAREGEILGFLGPNGAGKTTTIQMLLDVLKPTMGQIRIFGRGFENDREYILRRINFSSTYVHLPGRLTVGENLLVFALLFSVPSPRKRIAEILSLIGAEEFKNKRYAVLSSGQKNKISLAKALINRPRLLLLDEPTASLDPEVADATRQLLKEIVKKEKMTILLTSHNMAEVEEMCDRVIFINHGKIVAQGTPLEITKEILEEEKSEPDLGQVFLKIVREFGP